jgi:hypothetical protein
LNPTSLDSLLMRAGSRDDPALWHRERGAWTPGGDSPGRDIRELAAALIHFGIGAGRTALVLGGEGPDTTRAALAVLTAGACLVRLDAGASDALLLEALHASRVALALVEDDRQLQRVLALRPDLPELELVILLAGEQSERKAAALLVASAVDIGAALLDRDPRVLARARADLPEVAPAVLVPSGARLTPLSADAMAALAHRLTDEVSVGPGRAVLVMLPPWFSARSPAARRFSSCRITSASIWGCARRSPTAHSFLPRPCPGSARNGSRTSRRGPCGSSPLPGGRCARAPIRRATRADIGSPIGWCSREFAPDGGAVYEDGVS